MVLTVMVFGGTGQQGGSVAKTLLAEPQKYKVKVITRNANSPAASKLSAEGAEVIQADLNNRESLAEVMKGIDACFFMTKTEFSASDAEEMEVSQGQSVVDVCLFAKVKHIIFSGQPHVRKVLGVGARHMDAKARIEDYINERGLPRTTIILPFAYEHFFGLHVPEKKELQTYTVGIPVGNKSLDMFPICQLGEAVKYILEHPDETISKTYCLSADKLTVPEIVAIFNKHLTPYRFEHLEIDVTQFQRLPLAGAADIAHMYEFLHLATHRYSVASTKNLIPNTLTFDKWVQQNKEELIKHLTK
ncbi:NmrA-like family domain-containing protein 1 [Holothuria leucospilota]|uniref:NmrA-like family domain-containing protein 1 n=1 Tax=Holothuria leucospilota TaxID=206669 RepID=A0A9Q1C6A6_HOLLE|nr:NmrA-like family domain-containing protein 1 [Holothuria leucospilota]